MEIIHILQPALPFVQIVLAVLLIAAILLQQRGSSLGGAFGGDNFSSAFHKRRGAELFLVCEETDRHSVVVVTYECVYFDFHWLIRSAASLSASTLASITARCAGLMEIGRAHV